MGMAITPKIIARAAGYEVLEPGDTAKARVSRLMLHDITGPPAADAFYSAFGSDARVWDNNRVVAMPDHLTWRNPDGTIGYTNTKAQGLNEKLQTFTSAQGIKLYGPTGEEGGVCHPLFCQLGYAVPGELVVGLDSHSVTYGGLGCVAIGVGSTDGAGVLRTGKIWVRVPEISNVVLDGALSAGVTAKDINLQLIRDFGEEGFVYEAIEYSGGALAHMNVDERLSLANMAIEAGAKNAVVPCDAYTLEWLEGKARSPPMPVEPDPNADYSRVIRYNASRLQPLAWLPPSLTGSDEEKIVPVAELERKKIKITDAWIGSCTGAKTWDFYLAAEQLVGQKVAEGVNFTVTPSTTIVDREIRQLQINGQSVYQILVGAGAKYLPPTCGSCFGGLGALGEDSVAIAASSRNTRGRMGPKSADVYLTNPAVVAMSAVRGYIVSPCQGVMQKPESYGLPAAARRSARQTTSGNGTANGPLSGRAYVVGPNINTDVIIPTRWLDRTDPRELAPGAMQGLTPKHVPGEFAPFEPGKYEFIIGGDNFGCGSSREHAVWALKGAGVKAVVVQGRVARIFYRNAINYGMPALVAEKPLAGVKTGSIITLDPKGTLLFDDKTFPVQPLSGIAAEIVAAGGLLPYIKQNPDY